MATTWPKSLVATDESIEAAKAELRRRKLWKPLPGPQTLAFNSEADILGYGGAAGGGKTDLLLGLAVTQHKHSVVFRRVFPNLRGVIERSREIFNAEGLSTSRDSYNESLHRWVLDDGRMVEFEACQFEKDQEKQRGRPRDFYGFDEVTEFTQSQVEFITAWNRSVNPDQRCRIVMTFNPPATEQGTWVCDFFAPWLTYLHPDQFTHPNPAAPGELRWYATIDGDVVERPDGQSFDHNGEIVRPQSRTFIPAQLKDNPYLDQTNYRSVLQSLPEPLKSQMLYGDFSLTVESDIWQIIPTDWIKAAQERWLLRSFPEGHYLTGVGIDVARGGQDKMVISKRYGNWFAELVIHRGSETPNGPISAALIEMALESEPGYINMDIIGIGSSVYDSLVVSYPQTEGINAAGRSTFWNKSGKFKTRNVRTEMYWRLREMLDPETDNDLALPPGNEIVADLAAGRYTVTTAGYAMEEKIEIKKRIGRSPDVGDAIALHFSTVSPVGVPIGGETQESRWGEGPGRGKGSRWKVR